MIIKFPGDQYEAFSYPGGEQQVRLKVPTDKSVTVEATIKSPTDLINLLLLGSALHGREVEEISLHIPYLPYARADRRFVDGDCHGLAMMMDLLSGHFDSIKTLDVHNKAKLSRHITNIEPRTAIGLALAFRSAGAVLFPDVGAKTRYAEMINPSCKIFYAEKKRDAATGKLEGFNVPKKETFEDTNVLVVDDICDGGGTFIGVADALQYSKEKISLYVTHGIFSKGLEELRKRFAHIYTTNSFYSGQSDDFVTVFDAFEMLKNSC